MRALIDNTRVEVKVDQFAVAALASESIGVQTDPMCTLNEAHHIIFRPSHVNVGCASHLTEHGKEMVEVLKLAKSEANEPMTPISRRHATRELAELESWIFDDRPDLLKQVRADVDQ